MTRSTKGYLAAALAGLGLLGCGTDPVKITGGGSLPAETGRAYFGFTANTCSADKIRGQVAYVDRNQGVLAHGEIANAYECTSDECGRCDAGEVQVNMLYRSMTRTDPGNGFAVACVSGAEQLSMTFVDGPFAGYSASGDVQGDVRFHACPDLEE